MLIRTLTIAFMLAGLCVPSNAQQPTGSPEVLALQGKLMQELSGNLQCNTQLITLQQKEARLSFDLAKAQARIKELEKDSPNAEQKP